MESNCSGNKKIISEKSEHPLKLGLEKVIQNIENPEWETYKMLKLLGIQCENPKKAKSKVRNVQNYQNQEKQALYIPDWNRVRCFLGRVWLGLSFVKSIVGPLLGTSPEGPGALLSIPGLFPALRLFRPKIHMWENPKYIKILRLQSGNPPPISTMDSQKLLRIRYCKYINALRFPDLYSTNLKFQS